MDPISALGAAAAAGQFAEQAITILSKLVDLYKRSRKAQATVKGQKNRLEQIKSIADQIRGNPALQTPTIASVLQNCNEVLSVIEQALSTLLLRFTKGGLWKVSAPLLAALREQHTENLFEQLKEHKMDLMLCLEQQNTTLISAPSKPSRAFTPDRPQTDSTSLIWNVPNRHIQYFVGRHDILDRLRRILMPCQAISKSIYIRLMGIEAKKPKKITQRFGNVELS